MTSAPPPRHRAEARRAFLLGLVGQGVAACTPTLAAPPPARPPATDARDIAALVRREIEQGRLPGAVVVAGVRGNIVLRQAFGSRSLTPTRSATTLDTIYDAASLTKVMATAVALQQLAERGQIELDRPAAAYWPAFAANGKGDITVRHLLTHYAVLPAGIPATGWSGSEGAMQVIANLKPLGAAGSRFLYSDVDFIVLGELVQRVSGQALDAYAAQHIFQPLGMRDTGFRPPPALRERIAPADTAGGRLRWGEVQDPVAHRMGGVAGHAGVFTTADDLTLFVRAMLGGGDAARILKPASIAAMTQPQSPPGGASLRGLGWDIDSAYASFLAPHFSLRSFGHTGYTGTALWLDPETQSFLIVLSNRLHPDGRGNVLPMLRQLADAVGNLARAGRRQQAMTGIDVLEAQGFRQLQGRRVGLLTNRSARDSKGRRTADVLRQAPGVNLVALFSPEHGLDASAEGRIDSGHDAATALPVHSLYGTTRRPTADMLAGLDTLVIDLPDVGTRYYTYATTMAYAMEEAGRQHIQVLLLDRPNPIRADVVQGPVLDPDLVSFITYLPLPTRHGLTMGELARYYRGENRIDARLQVVGLRRYERSQWFDQTGLAWVPPSPNLRKVEQAVLYPAVAMAEGANVSVGRGTDTPFEILGAPWIDGPALAGHLAGRAIAGVRIEPTIFTPRQWAFAGQPCQGVRFSLTDRDRLDTPVLGLELIAALQRLHPDRFAIDRTIGLLGSRQSLEAIKAGVDPKEIAATWGAGIEAYRLRRERYLMY